MITLPTITFGILLLGRLSPGPSALPYRHQPATAVKAVDNGLVTVVMRVSLQAPEASPMAFVKPPALDWEADWTREALHRVTDMVGLHAKNAPLPLLRDMPWNIDLAPILLRGANAGAAAGLSIKIDY